MLALLRAKPEADFAAVRGVSEGWNTAWPLPCGEATGLDDLYTRLKTKRYPMRGCGGWCWTLRWTSPPSCQCRPTSRYWGTQNCAVPFKAGCAARRGPVWQTWHKAGAEAAKNQQTAQQSCRFFGTL